MATQKNNKYELNTQNQNSLKMNYSLSFELMTQTHFFLQVAKYDLLKNELLSYCSSSNHSSDPYRTAPHPIDTIFTELRPNLAFIY